MRFIRQLGPCDRGGTAIEYGLVMALIVIVMIVGLKVFANTTIGMYNHVQTQVSNVTDGVG